MADLAALVEADRARLTEILGATPFTIAGAEDDGCRVIADRFTIRFRWHPDEEVLDSAFELRDVPAHAVSFTDLLHTWLALQSRGEDWPVARQDASIPVQLAAELDRVGRAVPILRDEATLREALLWEAGYLDGYAQWD